jgi:hypothetical protein
MTSSTFAQGGGGGMAGMQAACKDDFAKSCPNASPGTPDFRTCLQTNMSSFSQPCQDAIAKMRAARKAQGGGGMQGAGGAGGAGGGGGQ